MKAAATAEDTSTPLNSALAILWFEGMLIWFLWESHWLAGLISLVLLLVIDTALVVFLCINYEIDSFEEFKDALTGK